MVIFVLIVRESAAKLRNVWESAKKREEKFARFGKNTYLCTVKPQVWLRR
jgi:hypothetical protein